jgi:signal recognition particle GTPase
MNKQIEEIDYIETVLWEADHKKSVLDYRWLAQAIYNAGYRKASDVAREIFAEIERLKAENEEQDEAIKRALHHMGEIRRAERAEAINEFAERLKAKLIEGGIYPAIVKNAIDKIEKEMKGENNDTVSESED